MRAPSFIVAAVLALSLGSSPRGAISLGTEAEATVAVLLPLEEMVKVSEHVVVAQPVDRYSQWEELGGGKRIVTYTKLLIEEPVVGKPGKEIWVRTLGGKVDKIGQHVAGEAQLTLGETSLVFLAKTGGTFAVTGMAQGHYPLAEDSKDRLLKSSPDTGTLLKPKGGDRRSARDELLGETLAKAKAKIRAAKATQK